jgi:hypothetical protein
MPTKSEREYYSQGYKDGRRSQIVAQQDLARSQKFYGTERDPAIKAIRARKPKRKLSAWNKYVKANSKKPRFRYRNGKLNLKKMAVAFRKTPAGKKKRR